MYIPSEDMGAYDEWKAPTPTKKTTNGRQAEQGQLTRGTSKSQLTKGASQGQLTRGTSQSQLSRGTSQSQLTRGTSQSQLTRGTSQSQLTRETSQSQLARGTSQSQLTRGTSQSQLTRVTSQSQFTRGTSQSQFSSVRGRPTSMYGSLDRQPSRGQLSNGYSVNEVSSVCTLHNVSQESQQSRSRINRQQSQGQLKRQESGSCSLHYGSLDRQPSRGQLRRQPSSLTRQPSNLARQSSTKNITSGCSLHDEKLTERDTYQHNRPKWQNSLRGSSAPSRKQSVEKDKRGKPSYELGTHASRAKQAAAENGFTPGRSPRRRSRSKSATCRSSRSKSTSPDPLFASTYSSRAKQTEAIENETSTSPRKNSRSSKSPMRSRTNSTSSVHRRSKSPAKRSTSANVAKRRSMGNFSDDCEDAPDPLAGYTSFNKFREERSQSGHFNLAAATKTDRNQADTSAVTAFASRKISDSYSGREESQKTSLRKSSQQSASEYSRNGTLNYENGNTDSYYGKRSTDSNNGYGRTNGNGIANSVNEYASYGSYSKSTDMAKESSSGFSSSYSKSSGYELNSINGHSANPVIFPNGVGRTLSGAYKAESPSYTSDVSSSAYSQQYSVSRKSSEHKFESSGKISLGSLKKPSIESWDSSRSSSYGAAAASDSILDRAPSYRKGVSTTYIG